MDRPLVFALIGFLAFFAAEVGCAQNAPHGSGQGLTCVTCHLNHELFGNQISSTAGNANACLSCHQIGGLASPEALAHQQQAKLWPDVAGQPPGQGSSHRWDAGPSGRVDSLSGAPSAAVQPGGIYNGRYAASYTITITSAGNVGSARFDWSGVGPGSGSGANVLTGTNVPVEKGLVVSFLNARPAPAFLPGDQWRIFVRPDLQLPANIEMLQTMAGGKLACATCHDAHFQNHEPFDPNAPPYIAGDGQGRHFMRAPNDTDQMCRECHASRFVTNALGGSHPVGVFVVSNNVLHTPASLPLDKGQGQMWCSTCHQVHNSPGNDGKLLRVASESALCTQCHANVDATTPASHLHPASGSLWPGGQYGSLLPAENDAAQRGGCGNCHRTHGWPDAANATADYPSLLVEREEYLCLTCHDGSPLAKNLAANFSKTYRHPIAYTGRHVPGEDGNPAQYGIANRHAECADCHNVHQLTTANNVKGLPRVSVNNVSSTLVTYTFRGATDPTPMKEYEICFTCHSGWTTRPAGQADYALKFNTQLASFHPVEGAGKNTNINVNAFVNNWRPNQTMTCTDCHTSDDTNIRGPHGSAYEFILKKLAIASPARRNVTMASTELCFDCHRYDTYANNSASTTVKNYSRFSGENGHGYHVGSRRYPCYACHETHGTAAQPNLLVTGRSPGINTYTRTANGGTCNATCHGNESYSVTYPR